MCMKGLCEELIALVWGVELVVFLWKRAGVRGLLLQPLDAGRVLLDEVCPVLRGAR